MRQVFIFQPKKTNITAQFGIPSSKKKRQNAKKHPASHKSSWAGEKIVAFTRAVICCNGSARNNQYWNDRPVSYSDF